MRVTPFLLACAALLPTGAQAAEGKPLTVRVFAYVRVPVATLHALAVRGEEIFRRAGIETRWSACTPSRGDCSELLDGELLLKVVRRSWIKTPQSSTFGLALRDKHAAYFGWIFDEAVEDAAKTNHVPLSVLLGHVMAHEIGHLLGLDHSEQGIMHCQYTGTEIQLSEKGGLQFSSQQAALLQTAVTGRQNPSIESMSFPPNQAP